LPPDRLRKKFDWCAVLKGRGFEPRRNELKIVAGFTPLWDIIGNDIFRRRLRTPIADSFPH
jgi:hypothetical protein